MFTQPRLAPKMVRTRSFRAAHVAFSLLVPVAASLPPEWRYLAAHLRRRGTLLLIGLTVSAGQAGKSKRRALRLSRLLAFDLIGALHAAASAPGIHQPQVEQAALAYLQVVRVLAPTQ